MKIVVEHRLAKDQQYEDNLLKEYELTQHAFYEVEKLVWQTASIFIVLSLGGISFLFQSTSEHDLSSVIVITGIGFVSIVILRIWYNVILRWWSFEAIYLYRMREIESELGMWRVNYIAYLDMTRRKNESPADLDPLIKQRLDKLDQYIQKYPIVSVRESIDRLVNLLSASWVMLILREFALALPPYFWSVLVNWFTTFLE